MILALGFLLLALLAVAPLILTPKVTADDARQAHDPLDIYRSQLADIDLDQDRGQLSESDAAAARQEVERRMLREAARRETRSKDGASVMSVRWPLLVGVLFVATGLYALLGRYDLPAQPGNRVAILDQSIMQGGLTYGAALKQLQARLVEEPSDQQGWQLLGRTATAVGDYREAARAYERLITFGDPSGQWRSLQLEAYLALTRGRVTPAAELVAEKLANEHPANPLPDLYKGYGFIQQGEEESALRVWTDLLARTPQDAPWRKRLEDEIAALTSRLTPPNS